MRARGKAARPPSCHKSLFFFIAVGAGGAGGAAVTMSVAAAALALVFYLFSYHIRGGEHRAHAHRARNYNCRYHIFTSRPSLAVPAVTTRAPIIIYMPAPAQTAPMQPRRQVTL